MCKCMCKTGAQYLSTFGLWKPFSEHLPAVCVAFHDGGESAAACVCIDFCFHLGKTGDKTYKMLQVAFRESCLSLSKTSEWYSHFKSGRRSFEDDPRPGRPSTSHTEEGTCARNHLCWPTSDYLSGCRGSQNSIQYVPENSNRRFAYETCDSEICATSPDGAECPCPQGCHHKWISGKTHHYVAPTSSLLPWPCSVWLPLVPTTEENNERSPIQLRWRDSSQHNKKTEGYNKNQLPEEHWSVAGMLEKVHTRTRTLLRRRQDQLAVKSTHSLKKISPRIKWSAHVYLVQKFKNYFHNFWSYWGWRFLIKCC